MMTKQSPQDYEPREYWERRLATSLNLGGVGHLGLGDPFNRWMYEAKYVAVRRLLERNGVQLSGAKLLDLGVGIGAWIPFWKELGIREIVGVDVSPSAIAFLRRRFPSDDFVVADVTQGIPFYGSFDLVTAFDVLYHVTDELAFEVALRNVAKSGAHGSWVLFSDGFGSQSYQAESHVYYRSMARYREVLEANSFEILDWQPVFFTMEYPISRMDAPYGTSLALMVRALHAGIAGLDRAGHTGLVELVGRILYQVDTSLAAVASQGPGLKVALLRSRGA